MSNFATDLNALMIGDPSINNQIDGEICYENLPDNFDLSKKWILYHFRKSEQVDGMTIKAVYNNYVVTVILIASNTSDITSISNDILTYLNNNIYGSIVDVKGDSEGHTFDDEKNIYTNTLIFDVIN